MRVDSEQPSRADTHADQCVPSMIRENALPMALFALEMGIDASKRFSIRDLANSDEKEARSRLGVDPPIFASVCLSLLRCPDNSKE